MWSQPVWAAGIPDGLQQQAGGVCAPADRAQGHHGCLRRHLHGRCHTG